MLVVETFPPLLVGMIIPCRVAAAGDGVQDRHEYGVRHTNGIDAGLV